MRQGTRGGLLALVGGLAALALITGQGGAAAEPSGGAFDLALVANVSPNDVTYVTAPSGDGTRLFIVTQQGTIRLFKDGSLLATPFLTQAVSCCGERGLLSMAFAPDYLTSGLFYIYYTNGAGNLTIDEYRRSDADPDIADPNSQRNVITIPHPNQANHNGGQLQFGPDGYLYIGTGDGGGGGDPFENGQSTSSLLGKILRIDPRRSGTQPYTVPAGNPFIGTAGRPEIWSLGLRNPYRFSFDRATGALSVGDVGQNQWEELDYALPPAAGRALNFGWDCREGLHVFESSGCPAGGFTEPVLEYSHSTGGCAVTGGYVVRDPGLEELAGRYVYADYCNGEIRSAMLGLPAATSDRSEGLDAGNPSSFGEDSCGRVYVTSLTGEVSRLVDSTPTPCEASPPDSPEPCSQSVRGTHRKDALNGGPGPQSIRGRDGDDRLRGGAGDDCLIGGGGDDLLTGGGDRDVLRGGKGRDVFRSADGRRERVSCGRGHDRARIDPTDRVKGCEKVSRERS